MNPKMASDFARPEVCNAFEPVCETVEVIRPPSEEPPAQQVVDALPLQFSEKPRHRSRSPHTKS